MRILYICGDLGIPAFGRKGASTHLREMIAALRRMGHEVVLAAADTSGDRRADEDFPIVKLPSPRSRLLGIDGRYILANVLARRILHRTAVSFAPDAIYERSALYFTAGEWASRRLGLPRILEVNCFLAEEQESRLHFPKLARRFEHRLVRGASAIASISNHMKKLLTAQGCEPARVRAFSMAVDASRFQPPRDPRRRRREIGWDDSGLVLGFVGSMNSYHRPTWFMDLAEKLLRRNDNTFRFLVVGGNPAKVQRHRARLLRWVEEGRVHFTGSVPQSEMAEWIAAMDAVLVPGASPQSTPTKIFEAAAVGVPVILPATEPIVELCGKKAPFLFKAEDFRSFETKVREFASDPDELQRAVKDLQTKVLSDHTWDSHAERIVDWFGEMSNAR